MINTGKTQLQESSQRAGDEKALLLGGLTVRPAVSPQLSNPCQSAGPSGLPQAEELSCAVPQDDSPRSSVSTARCFTHVRSREGEKHPLKRAGFHIGTEKP